MKKSASKIPKVRGGVRGLWKKLIFKPHIFRGKLPLGKIESVNGAMLKSLLEEESDLVVFMYREDNR